MAGISKYIRDQFPAFYQKGGEDFITFMEAYFEFIENDPSYSKLILQTENLDDIDCTLEEFVSHFKNKYLSEFPHVSSVDRRFVIKHISDFYKSKGSEKSVKLLLRLLLGQESDVYYPSQDILKPSDSKWVKPSYLEVSREARNKNFVNKQITGASSGATAFVEAVVTKRVAGKLIDLIYMSNVRGLFTVGEVVTEDGDLRNAPKIIGSLTTVDIELGGRDNKVGDIFTVNSEGGTQAKVRVVETVDATGRVDFKNIDGGYGYEAGDRSIVKVSSAVLLSNNANLDFIRGEWVTQRREQISLASASGFNASAKPGDVIVGMNASNTIIARGTVISVANTDASGGTLVDESANSRVMVYPTLGSFDSAVNLTTSNAHSLVVEDKVSFGGTMEISISPNAGTFANGDTIIQRTYSDHYLPQSNTTVQNIVTESSARIVTVLSPNNYQVDRVFGTFNMGGPIFNETNSANGSVSFMSNIMEGGSAVVTNVINSTAFTVGNIEGQPTVGNALKSQFGQVKVISALANSGVSQVMKPASNTTFSILTNVSNTSFRAQVIGQNTTAIGIWGNTNPISFVAAPTATDLANTNLMNSSWVTAGATKALSMENLGGEQAYVLTDTSTTSTGSVGTTFVSEPDRSVTATFRVKKDLSQPLGMLVRMFISTTQYASAIIYPDTGNVTIDGTGTSAIYPAAKSVVRGDYIDVTMTMTPLPGSFVSGLTFFPIGRTPEGVATASSTGSIIMGGVRIRYSDQVISFPLETSREKDMISPPRNLDGSVKEATLSFTQVSTGAGAGFKVGSIENDELVTLFTDFIGNQNIMGVPYPRIGLDGRGSGIGFVDSVTVTDPGTATYSNGTIIAFSGGGYANGSPVIAASGIAVTDATGQLTSVSIPNHGMGYFSAPTHNLAGDATIAVNMSYGYGFPKLATGGPLQIMDDLLTSEAFRIGQISSLTRINPGSNYNMNPFVWVNHREVSSLNRKDFYLTITNMQGAFASGERLYQMIGGIQYYKGEVISSTETYVKVRRTSVNTTVNISEAIYGSVTGSFGIVQGIQEDAETNAVGDNAIILGNVISANGIATKLEVIESGYGYVDQSPAEMWREGSPYVIGGITGVLNQGKGAGYWKTTNSHLSSDKKIHDNNYYQDYSYDIRCGISLDRYETLAKSMIHVAGTKMFGTVVKNAINKENLRKVHSSVSVETGTYSPRDHFLNGEVGWVHPLIPGETLYQDTLGTPVTEPGQPVGLSIDVSQEKGPDLKSMFLAQNSRNPPIEAVYDNVTGKGNFSRLDASNVSGIRITGLTTGSCYEIDITVEGPNPAQIRESLTGPVYKAYGIGRHKVHLISNSTAITIGPQTNGTQGSFILHSFREVPGNHWVQSIALNRPIYWRMPKSGRKNMFKWSNDFSNSTWIATDKNDYTHGFPDPFGGNRAIRWKPVFNIDPGGATRSSSIRQLVNGSINKARYSVYVKPVNAISRYPTQVDGSPVMDRDVYILIENQNNGRLVVNLNTLEIHNTNPVPSVYHNAGIDPVGDGWYRIWYTAIGTVAGNGNTWLTIANRTTQFSFDPFPDGSEEVHIFGMMYEYGDDVNLDEPPGNPQIVTTQYDVTEEGTESVNYLSFNGINQRMQSGLIDWGSDEVTLVAGFHKTNDNATTLAYEFGPTSNAMGSFYVSPTVNPTTKGVSFSVRGNNVTHISLAPVSHVVTGIGKIGNGVLRIKVNGGDWLSGTSITTGNFGNHYLNIGSRQDGSLSFPGNLYPSIAVNRIIEGRELELLEEWITERTGGVS